MPSALSRSCPAMAAADAVANFGEPSVQDATDVYGRAAALIARYQSHRWRWVLEEVVEALSSGVPVSSLQTPLATPASYSHTPSS